ncbi:MAG: LIC12162 family protein [Candidatus Manganitrophus sp. SB1]|nr:LIC12162 family protein [Candidatus Manganitrophus morganii]
MNNAQADRNEKVFLATTALEQYWDTTKPIVFLGEWCLLHGRRSFWEPLHGQILETPFNTADAAHAAYVYIHALYERILPIVGKVLNTLHGKEYSERYWRIVLGPWLRLYLSVSYDRYSHLQCALERYPDCETLVLPEASYAVPSDTLDFAWLVKDDSFNLQIYTKILAAQGRTFPSGAPIVHTSAHGNSADQSWKENALNTIAKIVVGIGSKNKRSIFLRNSYFSKSSEIRLSVKTTGRVLPILRPLTKQSLPPANSDLRKSLPKIEIGQGEFERCLSAILLSDIPRSLLEGYSSINHDVEEVYPKNPKAILSANAWHFEETFKQWAAISAEKGTLLIGTPHGGNYGGPTDMSYEDHETSIVDRYYSWGWERKDCAAEVIPFPANKLVGREKNGASNLKEGILWVTTSEPRYLIQYSLLPKSFHEYLRWQGRFAKTLDSSIVSLFRLRPHREDQGWSIAQRITECIPDIKIETWDVSFQESLANCRLYVCDHLSTTFAEALAADKPTLLFWNPEANRLRAEAQPYYDLLRKSGILFDTPESAGAAVHRVYDDVEAWWKDPDRQDAVKRFCERFARNSPDAIELWTAEFKRIAAVPGNRKG